MTRFPAVKFALTFIAGIIFNKYYQLDHFYLTGLFLFLLVFILFLFFTGRKINSSPGIISLYLIILLTGNFNAQINSEKMNLLPKDIIKEEGFTAYGTIDKIDLLQDQKLSYLIETDSCIYGNYKFKGKVKLIGQISSTNRSSLDSLYSLLDPGDRIKQTGLFIRGKGKRNPGEFDYDVYLQSKNISGILRSTSAEDIKHTAGNKTFEPLIFQLRKSIDNRLTELHSKKTASFLRGLLMADRSGIDYQTKEEFINAGVMHVLAVSGMHTVYIALIFLILFGRFNIIIRSLLTAAGILFFLMITGMQVSVFRAVVMGVFVAFAFLTNRSTNIFNSLAVAALIILIVNPEEIYNPGFQLSFAAVLSIALIYPVLKESISTHLTGYPYLKKFLLYVAVSLAAQIGTLPITIYYFGKLSIISIAANIFIIPLGGILIATAALTLIISFIPLIPVIYAAANELFTLAMFEIVSFASSVPLSFLYIIDFSITDVITAYGFIIFYFLLLKKMSIKGSLILLSLVIANITVITSLGDEPLLPNGKFSILMIDVGQGDAFLVKSPGGKIILIDAGQADRLFDRGERTILPLLDELNISRIDYAFISHLDLDHYGGIIALVHKGRIGHLLKAPPDQTDADEKFEKFLKERGQSFSYYYQGIMKVDEIRIYILNNKYHSLAGNDGSGVLRILYGNSSVLFTGDITSTGEGHYAQVYGNFLSSDILKVSHHGSHSSTSGEFIKFVNPDFAFISAGYKNRFGHPSEEVITRLTSAGSRIYRTDLNSAVLLRSDGYNIRRVDWDK